MRLLISFILVLLFSVPSFAQRKKIDLDDVSIEGELRKDERLRILGREKNQLNNYIKFRTNFRKEIVEELPKPEPTFVY